MAIYDLFSKRKKKENQARQLDVYKYNEIPIELRRQIVLIWVDAIGPYVEIGFYGSESKSNEVWREIHNALCREYGIFDLNERGNNPFEKCEFFIQEADLEKTLDIIELSFRVIEKVISCWPYYERNHLRLSPDEAISELNYRFKEHGIGYEYLNGIIVRIDTEFIHSEVIKPALNLLHEVNFKGAEDEFIKAHDHYRNKRNKEAIAEALKSFESTMKTICKLMNWTVSDNATSQALIKVCIDNGLIPSFSSSHLNALKSTLESGLPTVRNKTSGHGQGMETIVIPPHLASYALNLAASNIVFLVSSYQSLKQMRGK